MLFICVLRVFTHVFLHRFKTCVFDVRDDVAPKGAASSPRTGEGGSGKTSCIWQLVIGFLTPTEHRAEIGKTTDRQTHHPPQYRRLASW